MVNRRVNFSEACAGLVVRCAGLVELLVRERQRSREPRGNIRQHCAAAGYLLLSHLACVPPSPAVIPADCEVPPAESESARPLPSTITSATADMTSSPPWLPASAAQRLLAIDPQARGYRIRTRHRCIVVNQTYVTTLEICVSAAGSVSSVAVVRRSIRLIDDQFEEIIPRWRFHPYLVDGRPSPFCYRLNYRVSTKEKAGWLF